MCWGKGTLASLYCSSRSQMTTIKTVRILKVKIKVGYMAPELPMQEIKSVFSGVGAQQCPCRTAAQGINDTRWLEVTIRTARCLLWLLGIRFPWHDSAWHTYKGSKHKDWVINIVPRPPVPGTLKELGEQCFYVLPTHTQYLFSYLFHKNLGRRWGERDKKRKQSLSIA